MDWLKKTILEGKPFVPKRWVAIIAFYVLPVALAIVYFLSPDLQETREWSGNAAMILVLVILFVKPVSVLFSPLGILRTIKSWRKEMGISAFYFALFHFLTYVAVIGADALDPSAFFETGPLLYGRIALFVMFVLWITSNKASIKILKRWWKRLHWITYLLIPLIFAHTALLEGEGYANAIFWTLLFVVLKVAEKRMTKLKKQASDVSGTNAPTA